MSKRINKILNNNTYKECIEKISKLESERKFCKHDIIHFLNTARIGYILNLERNLNISKDMIYGAALLHDIGKFCQYENNIPHEIASVNLCSDILEKADFNQEEIDLIKRAILSHRDDSIKNNDDLLGILYRADKLSRECYCCEESFLCNWPDEKKNIQIIY